jgi:hypothetical protein
MAGKYLYLPGLGYCRKKGKVWLLMQPGKPPTAIPAPELYDAWLRSAGNSRLAALFDYPGEKAQCLSGSICLKLTALQTGASVFTLSSSVNEIILFRDLSVINQYAGTSAQLLNGPSVEIKTHLKWNGEIVMPHFKGYTGLDAAGPLIKKMFYGQGDLVCTADNGINGNSYLCWSWSAWKISKLELDP